MIQVIRDSEAGWRISTSTDDKISNRLGISRMSEQRRITINGSMTYDEMLQAVERLTVRVISDTLPGDIEGAYDEENQIILLDRRMTSAQKRSTLTHELYHWIHGDNSCNPTRRSQSEKRVCRETAKLLVSPQRYARAEQEYDGEIYQIACELEVTVKVLEDYREWLRNQPSGASLEEV